MAIEVSLLFTMLALSDFFFIFLGFRRYIGWRLGLLFDLRTANCELNRMRTLIRLSNGCFPLSQSF